MIAAVVAIAHGGVIGNENDLPWYLPADLRRFKQLTTGHAVIMGRKTADSIVARLGHALPDRKNIVVTRQDAYDQQGFVTAHSIEEALRLAGTGDTFVIGGAQIYDLTLPFLDTIYATLVDAEIDGDAYFTVLNDTRWQEVAREHHDADDKNQYPYDFVELRRAE